MQMAVPETDLKGDSILELGIDYGDGELQDRYSEETFRVKVTGLSGILKMMGKIMLASMIQDF